MMPARASHTGSTNQDFLGVLGRVYGSSGNRRDAFGRRIALPSEIARALALDADDSLLPARLTDQFGCSPFPATVSQQDAGEV
jgi:hypothetical protein